MASKKPDLPETIGEWKLAMRKAGFLPHYTLHRHQELGSASQITLDHYLCLRVLHNTHDQTAFNLNIEKGADRDLIKKQYMTTAGNFLRGNESWELYVNDIQKEGRIEEPLKRTMPDLGTFSLVRHQQIRVITDCKPPNAKNFQEKLDFSPESFVPRNTRAKWKERTAMQETPTKQSKASVIFKSVFDMDTAVTDLKVGMANLGVSDSGDGDEDDEDDEDEDDDETDSIDPTHPGTGERRILGRATPQSAAKNEYGAKLYPPTVDEQIVNTALLAFLDALTIHFTWKGKWSIHRKPFIASWSPNTMTDAGEPSKLTKLYEARVDGYLEDSTRQIKGLIEVKPFIRNDRLGSKISQQEAAQLAASISEFPPEQLKLDLESGIKSPGASGQPYTRLMVAQDRHEIYLIFAEFYLEYYEYLQEGKLPDALDEKSFLRCRQYGPWTIDKPSHVRAIGTILLAWTLQECDPLE